MTFPRDRLRRDMLLEADRLKTRAALLQDNPEPKAAAHRESMENAARLLLQAENALDTFAPKFMALERDMAAVLVDMHDLQRKIMELR